MKLTPRSVPLVLSLALLVPLAACEDETHAEELQEGAADVVDETGDLLEDGADEVQDAAEEGAEAVEEAVEEAGEGIDG